MELPEVRGNIKEALQEWGLRDGSDDALTWELFVNLYLPKLTPTQQRLVRSAKRGSPMMGAEWPKVLDDLAALVWRHLENTVEL